MKQMRFVRDCDSAHCKAFDRVMHFRNNLSSIYKNTHTRCEMGSDFRGGALAIFWFEKEILSRGWHLFSDHVQITWMMITVVARMLAAKLAQWKIYPRMGHNFNYFIYLYNKRITKPGSLDSRSHFSIKVVFKYWLCA